MSYKIISINLVEKTMVVDWGYLVLNQPIPQEVLDNPDLGKEDLDLVMQGYKPMHPEEHGVPPVLADLLASVEGIDQTNSINGEITI